jgi:hypothetical protein
MTKIILVGATALLLFAGAANATTTEDAKSDKTQGVAVASDSNAQSSIDRSSLLERASRAAERESDRKARLQKLQAARVAKAKAKAEAKAKARAEREARKAAKPKPKSKPHKASPSGKPITIGSRPTGLWLELAKCESGANLRRNSGNGYYGAYQFSPQTWQGFTHGKYGSIMSNGWKVQTYVAYRIWLKQGWGGFPGCGNKMGHPRMPAVTSPRG